MPVYLNEPISMLQRSCELFEHTQTLDNANNEPNQYKRLAHAFGFIIMNLSQVIGRSKKPFNPLLGETFEVYHNGVRCICEQVSHHPPISALFAENENFRTWGFFEPKSKFSFTKMIVTPKCNFFIELKKTNEKLYVPYLPQSSVHNIIRGDIYVWNYGECEILNITTGDKAIINLKTHPYFGSLDYTFTGQVLDNDGNLINYKYNFNK